MSLLSDHFGGVFFESPERRSKGSGAGGSRSCGLLFLNVLEVLRSYLELFIIIFKVKGKVLKTQIVIAFLRFTYEPLGICNGPGRLTIF